MMTTLNSYLRRVQHTLRRLWLDPQVRQFAQMGAYVLAGVVLSAASLSHSPQPFALGLVLSSTGWPAVLIGLGGSLGYWLFWGQAGMQGLVWMALGLLGALTLGERPVVRQTPLLLPACAGLLVAATGVVFQTLLLDDISVPMYLLRIVLGSGSSFLFTVVKERRDPITDWLAGAVAVLALAQIAPISWLGLGFIAAGALGAAGAFPAAALAGLALDLAQVTEIPMTAVLCLVYFVRLIPFSTPWLTYLAPGSLYLLMCALTGRWDLMPLPGLVLGGILGRFLPGQPQITHRRGETGIAQVRLEMTAGVLSATEQMLLEVPETPIDEEALLQRAVDRACGSCPCRKNCRDKGSLSLMSAQILHRPLLTPSDLRVTCRKSARVLVELHRTQEQLRSIKAAREQLREYRTAVVQQYRFLACYLQDLSDSLSRRGASFHDRYRVRVSVYANQEQGDNGDRCLWFAGTEGRYYVLLCDGMGTGIGAVDEGQTASQMLKTLLSAGFPPEHALQSLNSLCALRGSAGAATVDLAEIHLDTGRTTLYKWGAAPSYRISSNATEKIGTAGPPPGLSVAGSRETVHRLSLRRGELLVLLSDGAQGEEVLRPALTLAEAQPGVLAELVLSQEGISDDATVAFVRLTDAPVST